MSLSAKSTGVEVLADNLEKPLLDDRTYRVIRLPNQLEALLIHDPKTDKAAASVDVRAGSLCDETDLPGMAHAVEHMLFLGNEKYPKENDYTEFLAAYAGSHNAFTAQLSTNYFFEMAVQAEDKEAANGSTTMNGNTGSTPASNPFYGGLDRFSQFFVKPLFLADSLDRELRAVDSENKKNLQSDVWRLQQLRRGLSNPEHPNAKFSTGNLKTLRDDPVARGVNVRNEFMRFYDEQYSANRMKLCVLGRESLDQLQAWSEELFSGVPNKMLKPNHWDIPLLTEKELLTEVFAKPVMESRSLELLFLYPDEDYLWESQPGRYLSHLIGHEGPGSILAYLKGKGWANSLSCGFRTLCPGTGVFEINITLTPEGLTNYQVAVKTVFQYISILHETPPQEWIFNEMRDTAEVDFRFQQKKSASSTASSMAGVMQRPLPRDKLLSGLMTQRKFNPEAIERGTKALNTSNFRLTVVTQDNPPGEILREKWYGTEYSIRRISDEFLSEVRKAASSSASDRPQELYLPGKNEFIPSRLEVDKKEVEIPATRPRLVRNDGRVRLWHKKDDQFWIPKASYEVKLRNPICSLSARNGVMGVMYSSLVSDALSEYAYDAELTGLDYGFSISSQYIACSVNGYNDKMSVLLEKVLTTARDLVIKDDRFAILKERLERGFRNTGYRAPYQQIGEYARWLGNEKGYISDQYLAELVELTPQDIRNYQPLLFSQVHIEALANGNLYLEDALKLTDLTEKILSPRPLPPSQWPIQRAITLPEGSNYTYSRTLPDPAQVNHAIEYVVQIGEIGDRARRACLLLLDQMTHEPAFDRLRTKEQLGYVVFSGAIRSATMLAYRFIVQSERPPEYLETRIESFLRFFKTELAKMEPEHFESHRRSKILERRETLKKLSRETDRFWTHISDEMYHFEEMEDDAQRLEKVTKEEMVDFFARYIDPDSKLRAKYSVYLRAQGDAEAVENKMTPEDQKQSFLGAVAQFTTAVGGTFDDAGAKKTFEDVDISKGDKTAILDTLRTYLLTEAAMVEKQVDTAMEQAKTLLPNILMQLGIKVPAAEADGAKAEDEVVPPPAVEPVVIEDVHAFKASMALSTGAAPIRDLSFYEELGSKL